MPIDIPPPPPPIVTAADSPSPMTVGRVVGIRSYQAGPASCAGEAVAPLRPIEPIPDGFTFQARDAAGRASPPHAVSLTFAIDSGGRPVSIRGVAPGPVQSGVASGDDLEPALAAARFAPGAPRAGCRLSFAVRETMVADADPQLLMLYVGTRGSRLVRASPGEVSQAARARLRPAGATCPAQPGARVWAWPDFDRIASPGAIAWNVLAFDIDAKGKAVRIRLLGSSGNAALDRGSVGALKRSVFRRPATGCLFNFYRGPSAPHEPPPPGPADFDLYREPGATCASEPKGEGPYWSRMPTLVYPEGFRRRAIEGWAVVRYDLAPWGEVANVRAVEAQPASGFGESARSIVQLARRAPQPFGYTGCLETVRFKLPPPEGEE